LIGMIADRRMAKTKEPLICYWPGMAVGDIAFVLLIDLCTDTGRRTTVPGADWTDLLGPGNDAAAWEQLHGFIKRRGSRALQDRWRVVWNKYRRQVSWDSKERCFKLKANCVNMISLTIHATRTSIQERKTTPLAIAEAHYARI